MRTFVIALGAVALVVLGSGSAGAEDAAVQSESAGIQVAEAPKAPKTSAPAAEKASKPMDPSASGVVDEGKSAKKQLKDDSADNKKRAKKGAGKAGDDIKRTFKNVFKKK
jgi:hypothetical protein